MRALRSLTAKIPLLLRVVSLYVVLAAVLNIGHNSPSPEVAAVHAPASIRKVVKEKKIVSGHPVRVTITRLGVSLPVVDGVYDQTEGSWTLSDDKAQFATETTEPNDDFGTTFIYGHNIPTVFEPLKDLTTGDILTVETDNGHTFTYRYLSDEIVSPEDTSILDEHSASPRVILMTCNGIWSENRRVMYFELQGVA